jgi:Acetyltransferase (GNAT) domain
VCLRKFPSEFDPHPGDQHGVLPKPTMSVLVNTLDPLRDPRWPEFLQRHPRASVFHSPAWLNALRRTYDYESVAFTTAADGQRLTNGLVFCRIYHWLTGLRVVSLPFSDHCEPLVDTPEELGAMLSRFETQGGLEKWKYFELRPLLSNVFDGKRKLTVKSQDFVFHTLDLGPGLNELFNNFHRNCIQRKILKAGRERLICEEGRSEVLLTKFYRLLLLTRRRHQLPPQPLLWFRNLIDCFGQDLTIRVASKDAQPIASIITLTYKKSLVYKYGCSDDSFHNLGGMPFLFWQAIQAGKKSGATDFDLGRSDLSNPGLATFKDRLGAMRSNLCYLRVGQKMSLRPISDWKARFVQGAFAYMPDSVMKIAGHLLYRHVG